MKKLLLTLALVLSPHILLAADSTILTLPETTAPAATDMMYIVTDPGGAPVDNKITLQSIFDTNPDVDTLDTVFDRGKVINGANSKANAVRIGSTTDATQWCIYNDATAGLIIEPCTDQNSRFRISTNFTGGIFSVEGDLDVEVYDPDAFSATSGTLTTQTGFQRVFSNLGTRYTASDTNPTCASGNYGFNADLSETLLKLCNNGTLSNVNRVVRTIVFSALDNAVNDTDYLLHSSPMNTAPTPTSTAAIARSMVSHTGVVSELYCKIEVAPVSTNTVIFSVVTATTTNGALADSSMTFTITGANLQGSTTANPVSVTKGDFIGIKKVDSASATPSDQTICYLTLEG